MNETGNICAFSPDRVYRYTLLHSWADMFAPALKTIAWIALNPSTADENQLDPKRFMRVNRQFVVSAAGVSKLSTHFLGKMRIHMTAFPDVEIIVSKDKVSAVKHWLDS